MSKTGELESILEHIAAIAHHGGLIGFTEVDEALNEIRKLSLPWWNKQECGSLQRYKDNL